jgi:Uma2 family endonuclease
MDAPAPQAPACYAPSVAPTRGPDRRGPHRADEIGPDDGCEVSNGALVECLPTGGGASGPNGLGVSVVTWDPAVTQAGVDTGYTPTPFVLRAPDVAVGNVPDAPGWVRGAPELAIEYADVGQNEERLQRKIADLLDAGTRYLWVVRLAGPRRIEVHEPGKPARVAWPGETLAAPGVLQNPVRVEALYDRVHAEHATLTNLLQRRGYPSLDAAIAEGRLAGARASLRRVLARRGITLGGVEDARIEACGDGSMLERWLDRAVTAGTAAEALE